MSYWPTTDTSREIISAFGPRAKFLSNSGMHYGIDIPADDGQQLYAPMSGVVSLESDPTVNYICRVTISPILSYEFHGVMVGSVSVGKTISAGQPLCLQGLENPNYSSGPHCHLGFYENGQYVNPINYLAGALTPPAASNPTVSKGGEIMIMSGTLIIIPGVTAGTAITIYNPSESANAKVLTHCHRRDGTGVRVIENALRPNQETTWSGGNVEPGFDGTLKVACNISVTVRVQ
jgi:hypothetical protein